MEKITTNTLNAALNFPVVVIDFMADWCQPCKPVTAMLLRIKPKHPKARFYQANVDELSSWAESLHVSGVPTIVFFTNGQPVTTILSNQISSQRIEEVLNMFGV